MGNNPWGEAGELQEGKTDGSDQHLRSPQLVNTDQCTFFLLYIFYNPISKYKNNIYIYILDYILVTLQNRLGCEFLL